MALDRQLVNLSFFDGVDSKTDPFQVPLGKLLVLQNAVFTAPGKLQKRNGYTALTTNILGGGTISTGQAVFTRLNELCMVDNSATPNMYSYDQSNTAWVNKGKMPSVTTTMLSVGSSQYSMQCIDMAQSAAGIQCFVFELFDANAGTKQGLAYSIVDSKTGQIVVAPSTLDSTASSVSPHVVLLGTNFVAYYIQGDLSTTAGIYGKTLAAATPNGAWSAATQLTSGTTTSAQKIAASAYNFDVCVSGTNAYLSFNNRSDGTTIFQATSVSPLAVNATKIINTTSSRISCIFPDVSGDIVLGYATSTAATAAVYDTTLVTQKLAPAVIDNSLSNYVSITGTSTATNTVRFFIGNSASGTAQQIRTNTLTTASYTVGSASTLIRQLNLAAKAFTYSGAAYVSAWYSPQGYPNAVSTQQAIFLLDSSGNLLAKGLQGIAAGTQGITATEASVANAFYQLGASNLAGQTVTLPAATMIRIVDIKSAFGTTFVQYQLGGAALSFNFYDTTNNYLRTQLANAVYTSGGLMQMYDGANVVEHGFLIYPEQITATAAGSGGSMSAGAYQYMVVYSWMDGQGQIHRSVPSAAVSVTTTSSDKVTLVIPTLRATAKSGVMIDVYRTQANLSTFYQVSNFNNVFPLYNSKSADTVTLVDTLADTSINTAPQVYTTGGVLADYAPPPAGPMVVHRNRMFVVDSTNPTQIWYSKIVVPPYPVEFSGLQVLNIDPKGGPITALASLDDKLIIFKQDRIFMVLGQGPDSTGGQNDYTDAILVNADTGVLFPKSVVVVPDGLMFQASKPLAQGQTEGQGSFYLLSRALQLSYIGAPVENMFAIQCVSAVLDPNYHMVRFTLGSVQSFCIVYDYLVGQWSKFVTANGTLGASPPLDATSWTGGINGYPQYVILVGGSCFYDSVNSYYDVVNGGSGYISMSLSTGWIKLDGLQGFQRVRRAIVLGNYLSPHTLTVTAAYDYYNVVPSQTTTFAVGADTTPYQYMIHLAKQKCEAIQLTVADSYNGVDAPFPGGLTLSGLQLEIGVKKGLRRIPATQTGG